MNCFHFFRTEKKIELHKRARENKDLCNIIMPSEDTKILEFNQYQESDKGSFIMYADLKCIREKINRSKNYLEHSSSTEVNKHIPSGLSVSTISSFKSIENKHHVYRGKYCMKSFANP